MIEELSLLKICAKVLAKVVIVSGGLFKKH
jgi:hypothetical protein